MPPPRRLLAFPLLLSLLPALTTLAQDSPPKPARDRVRADVAGWDIKNKSTFDSDPDHFLRAGLVADRTTHTVTLKAIATGLGSEANSSGNEAVEFFLIGPSSSKSYEALAISFAKPSDVYSALRFIGLPQGRAVNYSRNRFWPRGERVTMTFHWEETSPDGNVSQRSARAEDLLLLRNSRQPLPPTGLVFVGNESQFIEPLNGLGGTGESSGAAAGGTGGRKEKQYYGDLGDPGSIASNYNDATTVLDLPALARQSEVYQSRIINPAYKFRPDQPLEVTLKWETPSQLRVLDVDLAAVGDSDLSSTRFALKTDKSVAENLDTPGLLDALTNLVADKEPFVTVHPGPDLPLKTVKQMYGLLQTLQTEMGIRLEPPSSPSSSAPGGPVTGLFHEAFTPDEKLRDYHQRMWQPIEIHFEKDKVLLRDFEAKSVVAEGEARVTPRDNPVTSPADLKKLLSDRADLRKPIAVYAPERFKYGQLMTWLAPALTGDEVVWIYLE